MVRYLQLTPTHRCKNPQPRGPGAAAAAAAVHRNRSGSKGGSGCATPGGAACAGPARKAAEGQQEPQLASPGGSAPPPIIPAEAQAGGFRVDSSLGAQRARGGGGERDRRGAGGVTGGAREERAEEEDAVAVAVAGAHVEVPHGDRGRLAADPDLHRPAAAQTAPRRASTAEQDGSLRFRRQ